MTRMKLRFRSRYLWVSVVILIVVAFVPTEKCVTSIDLDAVYADYPNGKLVHERYVTMIHLPSGRNIIIDDRECFNQSEANIWINSSREAGFAEVRPPRPSIHPIGFGSFFESMGSIGDAEELMFRQLNVVIDAKMSSVSGTALDPAMKDLEDVAQYLNQAILHRSKGVKFGYVPLWRYVFFHVGGLLFITLYFIFGRGQC